MQEPSKYCTRCGEQNQAVAAFCHSCGAKFLGPSTSQEAQRPGDLAPQTSPVSISLDAEGNFQGVEIRAKNKAEAKIALKELKLKKKEFLLLKRQINEQQRIIRANYIQDVRARGSKFHGGGRIGRVVRAFQTGSRDAARSGLASDLAPYERQKQYVEAAIAAIEKAILQLEAAILREF